MTTDSPPSSSSTSFGLLHPAIQRWVWKAGWTTLREAQERAVPLLLGADRDVIISAATASGKTEAAFLPILTHLLQHAPDIGSVLYVSPLKALINDQFGRMSELCETLEIPVVGWHGDIPASRKHAFLKRPQGVLLITPESLEALFVRRGTAIPGLMRSLRYVVIDEMHAFMGSERGKQLESLMHRVEVAAGRRLPRIGLSATLGDMRRAAGYLRTGHADEVALITSEGHQNLKIQVRGYVNSPPAVRGKDEQPDTVLEDMVAGGMLAIAEHLYDALRGSNNLVFPNSRGNVELLTDLLRRRGERERVANEFWAHHGNLARDIREESEAALKRGDRPATAVCTTTLELGIDIGAVKSIAQVGPPPAVASLRQRLGRSGRRKGEPAILRCYVIEEPLDMDSSLSDQLRESLVQTVAMVNLLLAGWYEPPRTGGLHASTLVQQILSIIAQLGGATAGDLWRMLVARGVFPNIDMETFSRLLQHMGKERLLMQDAGGTLLHGVVGERAVNHFEFYAAFVSDDELRLMHKGRALGSLPVSQPLIVGQRIIFAGRRWQVVAIDEPHKTIHVERDAGGAPPHFDGAGVRVDDGVRKEMQHVLASAAEIPFLDPVAQDLLEEGRSNYRLRGLAHQHVAREGDSLLLASFRGDAIQDALAILLTDHGLPSVGEGLSVRVRHADPIALGSVLRSIADEPHKPVEKLLDGYAGLQCEKWDWALPKDLLCRSYASARLDLMGARALAGELAVELGFMGLSGDAALAGVEGKAPEGSA